MNRKTLWLLVLLVAMLVSSSAFAKDDFATSFKISEAGILVYEVPENPIVKQGASFASFVIKWQPINEAHAYYIGVTQEIENAKGHVLYQMADGWLGSGVVKDGAGKEHKVEWIIFDSIELDGNATQVDIAPILNKFETEEGFEGYKLTGTYVIITMIPKSGPPTRQFIELPIS